MNVPLGEVEEDEPLVLEVVLPDDESLQFSGVTDRDLEPAQTAREEENASNEEDNEGDSNELLADLAAVSQTELGSQQ